MMIWRWRFGDDDSRDDGDATTMMMIRRPCFDDDDTTLYVSVQGIIIIIIIIITVSERNLEDSIGVPIRETYCSTSIVVEGTRSALLPQGVTIFVPQLAK